MTTKPEEDNSLDGRYYQEIKWKENAETANFTRDTECCSLLQLALLGRRQLI